jgi:hypothetical protein
LHLDLFILNLVDSLRRCAARKTKLLSRFHGLAANRARPFLRARKLGSHPVFTQHCLKRPPTFLIRNAPRHRRHALLKIEASRPGRPEQALRLRHASPELQIIIKHRAKAPLPITTPIRAVLTRYLQCSHKTPTSLAFISG